MAVSNLVKKGIALDGKRLLHATPRCMVKESRLGDLEGLNKATQIN